MSLTNEYTENIFKAFVSRISLWNTLYVVPVKSKVKILQNFVAFSEYMNFTMQYFNISQPGLYFFEN